MPDLDGKSNLVDEDEASEIQCWMDRHKDCIAAGCMGWRYASPNSDDKLGYCGPAGNPWLQYRAPKDV